MTSQATATGANFLKYARRQRSIGPVDAKLEAERKYPQGVEKVTHVFISYVGENRAVVDRLAEELSNHGATVWLDRKNIGLGSRWKDEIKKAIKNGDFFLACFSKEYDERQNTYMNAELALAIDVMQEMPADRTWFIPVLINTGRIPQRRISSVEDLSDLNAVDLSADWSKGIEIILKTIGCSDPMLSRALLLVNVARTFNLDEGVQAIEQLGTLQLADKRILGALIDATSSATPHRIKEAAVQSLVKIGRGAVPALAAALPTAEEVSRKCILHALEGIGLSAGAAVPAIITVLQETRGATPENYGTVQERALRALGMIGPAAEEAVPHLSILLKDSCGTIRTLAAFALTRIGPKGVPPLAEGFVDPEIQKDIVPGILWAGIRGSSEQVWTILTHVGLSAAVPGLVAALQGDNKSPKSILPAAVEALGRIGPDASLALPVLAALREKSPEIEGLDRALHRIGFLRNGK